MFYFLHRAVKWVFVALALAGLYWVWLQREAIEPVYVWYDVYENGGLQQKEPLQRIHGRVTSVIDGQTFQMHSDGKPYSVRLTGLEIPQPPLSNTEIESEKARRKVLRETLLSRNVEVEVTYSNNNSLLGVVLVHGTNLNIHFITNGLGKFNRAYVKNVPRDEQFRLFAAQRIRQKQIANQSALAMQTP